MRRRIAVPVDRLWHHVRCNSIAKLVRVQDELGYGSEVDVSRFVSEDELLSGSSRSRHTKSDSESWMTSSLVKNPSSSLSCCDERMLERTTHQAKEPFDRFHQTSSHHTVQANHHILQTQCPQLLRIPAIKQPKISPDIQATYRSISS